MRPAHWPSLKTRSDSRLARGVLPRILRHAAPNVLVRACDALSKREKVTEGCGAAAGATPVFRL